MFSDSFIKLWIVQFGSQTILRFYSAHSTSFLLGACLSSLKYLNSFPSYLLIMISLLTLSLYIFLKSLKLLNPSFTMLILSKYLIILMDLPIDNISLITGLRNMGIDISTLGLAGMYWNKPC